MTPKLLLALALVGAVHAGESVPPDVIYPVITIPSDFPRLASDITLPAGFTGKITVHREPTVTKKPDGTWEITFAGKAASYGYILPAAPLPSLIPTLPTSSAPPSVLWPNEVWQAEFEKRKQDHPGAIQYGPFEFSVEVSGKRYEFGLRSDGCVVWRERK